jgi:hypothetical protein
MEVGMSGWTAAVSTRLQWFRWLLWLALFALLAVGFDYKTPAVKFREISAKDAQQDGKDAQQDTTIAELGRFVRALSIGQCLDRPARETKLMGLPCTRLLEGTP